MHLIYTDQSGELGIQRNFVLASVAIYEGEITKLSTELNNIQHTFFNDITYMIPFHACELNSGSGFFRKVPEKNRKLMMDSIYNLIASTHPPGVVAFATVVNINSVNNGNEALEKALEDLTTRFNHFAVRQYKAGHPAKGLFIIDQCHEKQYRDLFGKFKQWGTKYGYLGNILDIPYFAGRRDTRMLQIADFFAYAVFRYYEQNDRTFLDKIINRFDARVKDQPDGLKHITKNKKCECVACSWRGVREDPY